MILPNTEYLKIKTKQKNILNIKYFRLNFLEHCGEMGGKNFLLQGQPYPGSAVSYTIYFFIRGSFFKTSSFVVFFTIYFCIRRRWFKISSSAVSYTIYFYIRRRWFKTPSSAISYTVHNVYMRRRWFKTSSSAVSYTISISGDGSKPQALLYPTQYLYQEMVQNLKLCCILHNIYIRRWF